MSLDQQRREGVAEQHRDWGLPFSVRLIFPGALLFVALIRYVRPLGDPDTFWHVRTGEWLRETWQFHGPDPFTRTATVDWTMHSWMPQILMSVVEQRVGLAAMPWLMVLGVFLIILTCYLVCRYRASILVSGFVTGASVAAMSSSISPRPQTLSFVFCLLAVHGWLATVEDKRARWWLVALGWVWANSHGLWFIGVVVGAVVLLGAALDRLLDRATMLKLGAVLLAQLAAAAVGPAGLHLLLAPFRVSVNAGFISEWQPASLFDVAMFIFFALAFLTVTIWVRSTGRVAWRHLLLLAVAVALSLVAIRLVAIAAAVLAPVAALTIERALAYRREPIRRAELITLGTSGVLGLAVAALMISSMPRPVAWGPAPLLDDIQAIPAGSTICNNFGLGGWLIYYAPGLWPVVDGRAEVFSPSHVAGAVAMESGAGWEEFVERNECSYALLADGAPAIELLQTVDGWNLVDAADGYTLLSRD